jgi:hypothetical protein
VVGATKEVTNKIDPQSGITNRIVGGYTSRDRYLINMNTSF